MNPSPNPNATLAELVTWQNRWLTERLEFLRDDLRHCLAAREPAAEDDYRRWLRELDLTQLLLPEVPPAPAATPTPDELLHQLQAVRKTWEAQFPENVQATLRKISGG